MFTTDAKRRVRRAIQGGTTLIELVVFIVVVSAAVAGVLLALNNATRGSADPMIRKQALAIAEALLEEVTLMPFTYCDADDAQVSTAQSATIGAGGCAATVEANGPESGETRYSSATPFDNVNDYDGLTMSPVLDITQAGITGLDSSYSATVTVANSSLGGIATPDADGQPNSLLITVTVTGPANVSVVLQGYRAKYAPRI
jgi:MSHA pilin protein MshD